MTIGAIAELKVSDYKILNNPTMHSIPSKMMVERNKLEMSRYPKGGK